MKPPHTTIAAAIGAAALSLSLWGIAPAANAEDTGTAEDPCATQVAQVEKAEDALARVTAVFAKQKTKVKKAREAVQEADSKSEKAAAKKALAKAKAAKDETKENKRAQQMRLAKALERLAKCRAEHPNPAPLTCVEHEDGGDTVKLNSEADTVTITGSGPGSAGSSLECKTDIAVTAGDTATFTYQLGAGTNPCGGGVPRMYFLIGGIYYNTIDGDPECSEAVGNTVTFTFPVTGTVTEVGFVYDRGDTGSVTYSNAVVDGVTLDI